MARPLRLELLGGLYHVTSGEMGEIIFTLMIKTGQIGWVYLMKFVHGLTGFVMHIA